jgi:drug/metabolite transporter (DMT)-like permease
MIIGELLAVLAAAFFGFSSISIRRGQMQGNYDKLSGLFVSILTNNLINIMVLTVMLLLRFKFPPLNYQIIFLFAAGGMLTSFLGRALLFGSIEHIGPSRAGSLKIIAPVFTLLLGVFFLKEKLTLLALFGITLALTGAYLCSCEQTEITDTKQEDHPAKKPGLYRVGIMFALFSGLSFGSGNIFRKIAITSYGEPIIGVAIGSLMALLATLIYFAWKKRLHEIIPEVPSMLRGGGYFWSGIASSLALYTMFTALVFSPVSIVNSIQSTEPLFTILASYLLLKNSEVLSKRLVLSSTVLILGVVLIFIGA